jgi:hypothetical protein
MAHVHEIIKDGDLIDLVWLCGDHCHRDWCDATETEYDGWNGCHEKPDYQFTCDLCGGKL